LHRRCCGCRIGGVGRFGEGDDDQRRPWSGSLDWFLPLSGKHMLQLLTVVAFVALLTWARGCQ